MNGLTANDLNDSAHHSDHRLRQCPADLSLFSRSKYNPPNQSKSEQDEVVSWGYYLLSLAIRDYLRSTPVSVPMCRYMRISGDLERMAGRQRTMIQSIRIIDTLLNSKPILPDESNDDTFTGH